MDLYFTVALFNNSFQLNNYEYLRYILEKCHVEIVELNKVESAESKNIILTENVQKLHVRARLLPECFPSCASTEKGYIYFLNRWCEQASKIETHLPEYLPNLLKLPIRQGIPWILIHNNAAFIFTRKPSHEKITLTKFQMGTLIKPTMFFSHYNYNLVMKRNSTNTDKVEATFYHDTKEIELFFGGKNGSMKFRYNNIRRVMVDFRVRRQGEKTVLMYFHLINPPALNKMENKEGSNVKTRLQNMLNLTTDQIGRCNTICIEILNDGLAFEIISRLYFRCLKQPIVFTVVDSTMIPVPSPVPEIKLNNFGCTYMVNALFHRNFILQLQNLGAHEEMMAFFHDLCDINSTCMYDALVEVLRAMDEGLFIDYRKAVYSIFENLYKTGREYQNSSETNKYLVPPRMKKVWRLVVTPTRLVYYPAEVNFENRIIRKYDSDYVLRVSFRDDSFRKLSFGANKSDEKFVNKILTNPILNGIKIGDRHFEFLGWSNSQLRDHGVFMYALDRDGNTAESIRSWMGNFTQIKSVAKFMARMGQCFSHSEVAVSVPLDSSRIITEPDIVGGQNSRNGNKPYVFSDGIGKISQNLMEEVAKVLDFDYVPSAIQFRYAGYKGMLAIDPNLKEVDIVFRESQRKFHCEGSHQLEVVNKSKPLEVLLNRNIITILDQKGISRRIFLKLQQQMIKSLTEMMFDAELAASYLTCHSALPNLKYKELARVGICPNSEPLFRNMLLAEHKVAIEGLRSKTRLSIETSEGRNMYGVLDETGTLEYGQVFVQYSVQVEEYPAVVDKKVLNGQVLVTKNPCLQLSDVRVFQAVDVSALHHIVDCIVFPQKGPRPHPNEMAGSDLDGDEYTVIWNKSLLFSQNTPAGDFPITEEKIHYGPVTIHDMLDFLSYFIVNDQIGVISNAHLAQADAIGLDSAICHEIALNHSIAVDFAKNGQAIFLEDEHKPKKYPDFMEKGSHKNTYSSKNALGKLYRVVKDYEDETNIAMEDRTSVEVDKYLIFQGWEKYKSSAEKSCAQYAKVFGLLLSTFGVDNEYDACGKACSNLHRRADRNERLDIEEILTKSIRHIWKTFEQEFYEEFRGDSHSIGNLRDIEILKKASAWYIVTYSNPNTNFLSFPWICWKYLADIRIRNLADNDMYNFVTNPYVTKLNQKILVALQINDICPLPQSIRKKIGYLVEDYNANLIDGTGLFYHDVEQALLVLYHWGRYNGLVKSNQEIVPSHSYITLQYLTDAFFISIKKKFFAKAPIMAELILTFLRYFLDYSFLTRDRGSTDSNMVFRSKKYLGKLSLSTYHSLAVGSDLKNNLRLATNLGDEVLEIVEMEPQRIDKEIVKKHFEDGKNNFVNFKDKLMEWFGANEVNIRELKEFLLVSASGSISSLRKINKLLLLLSTDGKYENCVKQLHDLSV